MEKREQLFASEMRKIKEKAKTTNALVIAQKQQLDQQTSEANNINTFVETAVKQVSEAKSKLWQLQSSRFNLSKQNREVREICYQRGKDIDALSASLKDCLSLHQKICDLLASGGGQELENGLTELEGSLWKQYEEKESEVLEKENFYKAEIEAKEKQKYALEEDVRKLEAETEGLEREIMVLNRIVEENDYKIQEAQEGERKLGSEVVEMRALLEQEKLKVAEEKEDVKEKLELVKKENCEILQEISLQDITFKQLQEKDEALSNELQAQAELKTSIEGLRAEVKTLQLTELLCNARNKQIFQTSLLYGFKYDDSLTENANLEQCKVFLANELDNINKQKRVESSKAYEEKMRDVLQKKTEIKSLTEETEKQIEKLKSDHLVAELQYNETQLEMKHQAEKQNKELTILTEQLNEKAKILQTLNDTIKQIETDTNNERATFTEKQTELDRAIERLDDEKKHNMQLLAESTEKLKKLERECDDLSYDIVKLDNKKAQLVRPEKETSIQQARFKKPNTLDETSESSFEHYSDFRRSIAYKKRKMDGAGKK